MQENSLSMDMNAGSTNLQVSRIEIQVLRNELVCVKGQSSQSGKAAIELQQTPCRKSYGI